MMPPQPTYEFQAHSLDNSGARPKTRYPGRRERGAKVKRRMDIRNSDDSGDESSKSKRSKKSSNDPTNTKVDTAVTPSQVPPPFPCCMIRDNDPRVHYEGSWTLNGTQFATTHRTVVSGSSISLHFFGVGIAVIGVVPASNDTFRPPTAVYTLDDQPLQTTLPFAPVDVPNQPLFASSSLLSPAQHILLINVTEAPTPFIIQSFFVPANFPTMKDMIGQLPTGATLLPSATIDVPTASVAISSTVLPSAQVESPASSPTSNPQKTIRILASFLGTFIFLSVAAGVVFLLYRRRKASVKDQDEETKTKASRRDTIYTWFTSTESIMRHDSSMFRSPLRSPRTPRSLYSRSEGRGRRSPSEGRTSTIDCPAPPLPPKPTIFILAPSPGVGAN